MPTEKIWRVAMIGFSHMHVGDQIRATLEHPRTQLVGVWDPAQDLISPVLEDFSLPQSLVFDQLDDLMKAVEPEILIVCSTTADHVGLVENLAPYGAHIILEKPFALSVQDADKMIAAVNSGSGGTLSINWPLTWYPSHRTTQRLIAEGVIGGIREIHYYDGNRGPLHHRHDKKVVNVSEDLALKNSSWWYSADNGGGSLLDYLGYGATLGTWFRGGEMPQAILAKTFVPQGLSVDEQSVVIGTYSTGLSVFQTRWGTFSDPWDVQPYPRCGFVVVGELGTILSEDYAEVVKVQTVDQPSPTDVRVDDPTLATSGGLAYLVDRLERELPIDGPSSWEISRAGQVIVDAAVASARTGTEEHLNETATKPEMITR